MEEIIENEIKIFLTLEFKDLKTNTPIKEIFGIPTYFLQDTEYGILLKKSIIHLEKYFNDYRYKYHTDMKTNEEFTEQDEKKLKNFLFKTIQNQDNETIMNPKSFWKEPIEKVNLFTNFFVYDNDYNYHIQHFNENGKYDSLLKKLHNNDIEIRFNNIIVFQNFKKDYLRMLFFLRVKYSDCILHDNKLKHVIFYKGNYINKKLEVCTCSDFFNNFYDNNDSYECEHLRDYKKKKKKRDSDILKQYVIEKKTEDGGYENCPICREPIRFQIKICKDEHTICYSCLNNYYKKNITKCPLCRTKKIIKESYLDPEEYETACKSIIIDNFVGNLEDDAKISIWKDKKNIQNCFEECFKKFKS
tara:strand:- start:893 stop:1969 length:1077 start_codon:yes stop_codon:yes gene_type:complete